MKVISLFLLFSLFSGLDLQAQVIENAWIKKPLPGLKMTAAYMLIVNPTDKELVLEKITGPDALYYEIHTHKSENGIMKMRQLKSIKIAPKSKHELKPMGDHIMVMQTNNELPNKLKTTMTLYFKGQKPKEINLEVNKSL